jgi:hypothetical protein
VVRGIIAKGQAPGAARSGEDVEIVKRITRRGNARPVITTGDAENVTVADDDAVVDDPVRRISAVEGKAVRGSRVLPGTPNPEVVDLLVVDWAFR